MDFSLTSSWNLVSAPWVGCPEAGADSVPRVEPWGAGGAELALRVEIKFSKICIIVKIVELFKVGKPSEKLFTLYEIVA